MFDTDRGPVGLLPGESHESLQIEEDLAFEVTCRELADGWVEDDRQALPDLGSIPTGPFLAMVLEFVDRSRLNGFDLVEVVKARERLIAHFQAQGMADVTEISFAAPGDASSDLERLDEAFEYAADEIRAALSLTRRAAEYRLSFDTDLCQRLPRVWRMLDEGLIDRTKARAFSDGTAHVADDTARMVVAQLADSAPRLTASQIRYRIRRLCIGLDPESARKREKTAREDRKFVIEPTTDGTADLHLLGLELGDARTVGRRVNGHMLSLKREDRSGRTHDQLRHDIARDFLLGDLAAGGGKGLVDIHVPVAILDGESQPAEVGGVGPVTAETARHIVQSQPEADHQITLVDDDGNPTLIYTLSRSATKTIRRHIAALQPTCSFPGCVAPAADCDYDHYLPWSEGGQTSTTNGGPKCDHDHTLRDHGWTHRRIDNQDLWTSPLGHSYVTQGQSP